MEESKRRRFVTQLERPRVFAGLVVAHLLVACMGFAPSVVVFLRKNQWWLNPVKQPPEWAHDNHPTMKFHAWISFFWVVLSLVQFLVTPALMLQPKTTSGRKSTTNGVSKNGISASAYEETKDLRGTAKALHRLLGYAAVVLLMTFAINANYLAIVNGAAGKIINNLLAIITGLMMMWHLSWAIYSIRNRDRYGHIREMCGLLSWTCFPGVIRGLTILPFQYFLLDEDCDVMSVGGPMTFTFPFCVAGLAALRWAAIGEPFRPADYTFFYLLIVTDVFLGLIDGTFLQCNPDGSLLEQIPGKAWTLKNW